MADESARLRNWIPQRVRDVPREKWGDIVPMILPSEYALYDLLLSGAERIERLEAVREEEFKGTQQKNERIFQLVEAAAWHRLADKAPLHGQMIFCTDGEHRWVDKFCPGVALEWYGIGGGRKQATHWCAVPELPMP